MFCIQAPCVPLVLLGYVALLSVIDALIVLHRGWKRNLSLALRPRVHFVLSFVFGVSYVLCECEVASQQRQQRHLNHAWRQPRMTAEGVVEGVKLSTEYLPAETLERSKVGNKFEKAKCAKPGDAMFTEVRSLHGNVLLSRLAVFPKRP